MWGPPPPPVPGPATNISRQIDPTVISFKPANNNPRPWVPGYDWAPAMSKTDSQWIADETDLPTIAVTEAEHDGRPCIVMSGFYDWDDAGNDDYSKRSRRMWTHLYSHIVATTNLSTALAELERRDLLGHDISNSPGTSNGYVGEFPYGHHHGEMLHVIDHESGQPLSAPTTPASWHILGEYEYAGGNYETISIHAPAPKFFGPAPGKLRWNGCDGWTDTAGELVAVLRDTVSAGQNELLIDAAWLGNWLIAEEKCLIWIENTGKDVYRGMGAGDTHPGALTRSQVHAWVPGSLQQTSAPGWDRIAARGE